MQRAQGEHCDRLNVQEAVIPETWLKMCVIYILVTNSMNNAVYTSRILTGENISCRVFPQAI